MLHVLHQKGRGDREPLPVITEEDRRTNEKNGIRTNLRIQTKPPVHDRPPAKGMEDPSPSGMDGNGEPNGIDEGTSIRNTKRPSQMAHNRSGTDLVYLHPTRRTTAPQRPKMTGKGYSTTPTKNVFTFITCLHLETARSEDKKTTPTISKTALFSIVFTFITKNNNKDLEKRMKGIKGSYRATKGK